MELWEDKSPIRTIIKEKYREAGIFNWTNDRVGKLCQKMRCSIYELCALCGVFSKRGIRKLWEEGGKGADSEPWPAYLTVQFAQLENFVHERTFISAQPPAPNEAMAARLLIRDTRRRRPK